MLTLWSAVAENVCDPEICMLTAGRPHTGRRATPAGQQERELPLKPPGRFVLHLPNGSIIDPSRSKIHITVCTFVRFHPGSSVKGEILHKI